jgi:hypothetical protein
MAKRPRNEPRKSTTGVPVAASPMQTASADPSKVGLSPDQKLIVEALERWKDINDWQGVEDQRSREDTKFANGDARNAWQWPTKIYAMRSGPESDELPSLSINAVRGHNDLIINQIAKNDWAPKIRPTGGRASYKAAEIFDSLIERILDRSKWPAQRRKVSEQQIDGGIGYLLVETAFVSPKSRNQEIYVRAARDPTAVFLDRYIREPDGSDARYGFEFERMPRSEFDRRYPNWAGKVGAQPLDAMFVPWITDKEIILCKYWRKSERKDELWWWEADGKETEKLRSDIVKESGPEIFDGLKFDIEQGRIKGDHREVFDDDVEWFLIAGNVIVDRGKWAGKYIPICRCVGRELVIDNMLDRKGHTRMLIDPQRMLNYHASIAVESIASEPKSKWLAPARATEGQEQFKEHNTKNFAVLTYNDIDDEAPEGLQKIDPPIRLTPPQPSEAHLAAIQTAERQIMMVSGQWQQQTGEPNAQQYPESGKAIGARQQQAETINFHFFDHQNNMERFLGTVLLDLIPKIYDTQRAVQISDKEGREYWLQIDPQQPEIIRELQKQKDAEIAASLAFNPKIGEYECVSDPGAYYATKRQDAWNALSQLFAQSQLLSSIAADIYFKNGDFEGAQELAERCQREIEATKPYLFGKGPNPAVATLQQQTQKLSQLNQDLVQKLAEMQLRLRGKEELRDIEAFKADTGRMDVLIKAVKELMPTPAMRAQFEHEITLGSHQHAYNMIQQANAAAINGSGTGQ